MCQLRGVEGAVEHGVQPRTSEDAGDGAAGDCAAGNGAAGGKAPRQAEAEAEAPRWASGGAMSPATVWSAPNAPPHTELDLDAELALDAELEIAAGLVTGAWEGPGQPLALRAPPAAAPAPASSLEASTWLASGLGSGQGPE